MTFLAILIGLVVGVLVGLFGIGGGPVLVPALVYVLGMEQHLAQGTSLFILLPPIGLGAFIPYWKRGEVDLATGAACTLGMLTGGYLGSLVAIPMTAQHLKLGFGGFLMLSALLPWRKTRQTVHAEEKARA